jgi:hypothetical protein
MAKVSSRKSDASGEAAHSHKALGSRRLVPGVAVPDRLMDESFMRDVAKRPNWEMIHKFAGLPTPLGFVERVPPSTSSMKPSMNCDGMAKMRTIEAPRIGLSALGVTVGKETGCFFGGAHAKTRSS